MKIIALTGQIGSGKSTVAQMFATLGVPVIDADAVSHELTKSDEKIISAIISHFGNDYCDKHQQIDRAKLRQRIFDSTEDKQWLEQLLHPKIYKVIKEKIKLLQQQPQNIPYIIIVIPLLFETDRPDFVDEVWNIDTREEDQIKRIIERDKITQSLAKKMIEHQFPRAERLKLSDKVILNNGDLNRLKTQVLNIHQLFIT